MNTVTAASHRFAGAIQSTIKATGSTLIPEPVVKDLEGALARSREKIKKDTRLYCIELYEVANGPFFRETVRVRPKLGGFSPKALAAFVKAKLADWKAPQYQSVPMATRPGATVWVDGVPGLQVPFKRGWIGQYEPARRFMKRVLRTVDKQIRKADRVKARQAKEAARLEAIKAKEAVKKD